MASFNIPCPSCESSVLIKSDALIGKKVECPKCKYRFTVEDPSEAGDGKAKKKGDGKKSAKKAKGGSGVLIGRLLGVLAVGLLAVGAYFLFFNDKGSSTTKSTGSPPSSSGSGGNSGGTPGTGSPDGAAGEGANNGGGQPDKPRAAANDKDVTNLLPG